MKSHISISDEHVSFWRYDTALESPVLVTLRLGEHQVITMSHDEGGKVTHEEIRDVSPDGVSFTSELEGSLTIISSGRHEEGWYGSRTVYAFDGETLTYTADSQNQDCDGRMDEHYEAYAATLDGEGEFAEYPTWETTEESHRDHTAEAAGY